MSLYGLYGGIDSSSQPAPPPTATPPPGPSVEAAAPIPVEEPKAATWSAALHFAPPKPRKNKAQPIRTSVIPLSARQTVSESSTVLSHTFSAPPILLPLSTAVPTTTPSSKRPSLLAAGDGDDVNGFRQTDKGKKAAVAAGKKRNYGNNSSGGFGKRGKGWEDPALGFGEDILYDPARPCDYAVYTAFLQAERTKRQEARAEEIRKARESSEYSEDDDESDQETPDDASIKKARMFAPPASYDTPSSSNLNANGSLIVDSAVNPSSAPRAETGEEAYQRRLALSAGQGIPLPPPIAPIGPIAPIAGPQAYPLTSPSEESRSTMSAGPQAYPPSFTPAAASTISAGPQAYPSFFATTPAPPPPAPSSFVRPSASSFYGEPSLVASTSNLTPPPPPPGFLPPPSTFSAGPSFLSALNSSAPTFRPMGAASTSAGPSTGAGIGMGGAGLGEAAARAKEIAARLGKLAALQTGVVQAAPPSTIIPSAEVDDRPFAQRMMSAYGWSEGKGLGATESGLTTALSVSRPAPIASKKYKGKNVLPPSTAPTSGMGSVGTFGVARGKIIDESRSGRQAAEVTKYGEPSRVVLLTNLCALDEVDDELAGEVAGEANKFGVVERAFVTVVGGAARGGGEEEARIFIVMSGLAGGYNAVKSFDERFFGGRVVSARFYDEKSFNAGLYTL